MAACTRSRVVASRRAGAEATVPPFDSPSAFFRPRPFIFWHDALLFWEEHHLRRRCGVPFERGRHRARAVLAKELLGALGHGQQPYHPFFYLNDATFPFRQVDTERLREAACHIED